ncbi:MAG: hypothetical protein FVQ79_10625 [Planctomycetes bacterium]|nr:hypothetical protein [Planctomycetota bacterium]
MKFYSVVLTQIILLVFSPVVLGAGRGKSTAEKSALDTVVVTVNGVAIMQSDLSKEIKHQLKMMLVPTEILTGEMRFKMRRKAIDTLIERQVVSDRVAFKKITVKDEAVYKRMQEIARQAGTNVDGFISMVMVKEGIGPEELKKRIKMEMCFDKLIELEAGAKAFIVKEAEAKRHYDKHIDNFKTLAMVRASHILIEVDGSVKSAQAKAKIKVDDIMKQVASGGDFSVLVSRYSDDESTKKSGGDLGFFSEENMMPEIAEAVFSLIPGEVAEPIKMPYGYHIVKVTDRKEGKQIPYDRARDGIVKWLGGEKKRGFSTQYVAYLLSNARIEWPREVLK